MKARIEILWKRVPKDPKNLLKSFREACKIAAESLEDQIQDNDILAGGGAIHRKDAEVVISTSLKK